MTFPGIRSAIKLVPTKLVNVRFIVSYADIKSDNFYCSNIISDYHFLFYIYNMLHVYILWEIYIFNKKLNKK